eukprot:TRINITY_DN17329_c0_g2_i2.p1 TRINITY_DN17329_c0_g2~~TRINITY_DN17329_c0_g2_i2.p1  ORF type:complete len:152 (+),score=19.46 TRINITY_DN17329_c0_g2_i2:273-728(+)
MCGGFCFLSNAAVAAAHALSYDSVERAAVLDFDIHHGNGTARAATERWRHRRRRRLPGDLLSLSIHEHPLYPNTGAATTMATRFFSPHHSKMVVNAPMAPGSSAEMYQENFAMLLEQLVEFDPQLIVVSAGFDAHQRDPCLLYTSPSPRDS